MQRIYLSSPDVGSLEEQYLVTAFRSGWIAPLGPDVDAFERELAERIGVKHAVALSSGTAALHLGLLDKGVGAGDIVLTSTMTFAATANAIRYTGATPYFIDCDISGNINPDLLENSIDKLLAVGKRPAAIVPVDLLGKACDYARITEVAERISIPVIADAAESLGASYRGVATGAWGDAAAFSFNGNKIMTTSGGGALMTSSDETAARVRYLATQARQPVAHYEHTEVGFNYRLSNLLAALGRAQLARLDSMIARRREVRAFYKELFRDVPQIQFLGGLEDGSDNCWLTSIVVEPDSGISAPLIQSALADANIESRPLWKPMHLQPAFENHPNEIDGVSERLFKQGLTLPSGSVLTNSDLSRIGDVLTSVLKTVART